MPDSDDPRARLDVLRRELGDIDREILALVARRQTTAQKIGQVKRAAGIPTRDYRQERDVIDRARASAVEHGLTATLGEELVLALIRGSLTVQEKDVVAASGQGSGRSALVIGGAGHMGAWFVRYLAAQGFAVEIADPAAGAAGVPTRGDWKNSVLDHKLIIVAAPMPTTAAILTALAESGEAAPKLATLSSTTFDAQLGVAGKVAAENPDLYFEIQTLNDYGTESLAALLYAVERLRSVVRANDLEGFRSLMTRGKAYLAQRR